MKDVLNKVVGDAAKAIKQLERVQKACRHQNTDERNQAVRLIHGYLSAIITDAQAEIDHNEKVFNRVMADLKAMDGGLEL